ncbi:MAG: hypothetical protein H5U10_02220 [Desulfacinum sp.]|jgi:hypothetical protein|nr:hypothetical protein [Desulfacinum sp.]
MKKNLIVFVALLAAVAVALPAFAVDFKYGGVMRVRWISNDNLADGLDKDEAEGADDNNNLFDQRARLYFDFVGSENLRVVTKFELGDITWGAGDTGDVGADGKDVEIKNLYLDFNIPNTPINAKLGVQGIVAMQGWIADDDFSAAVFTMPFEPVKLTLGYIAAQNETATDESENVDDFFIQVDYANGPFSGTLIGFYQYAHDALEVGQFEGATGFGQALDNSLFDLGVALGYKADMFDVNVNFVKNFGSYDLPGGGSGDYTGWAAEAIANVYVNNFTFTLGGFYTTGDDDDDNDVDYFIYPYKSGSHYWAELMGLGVLDKFGPSANDGYSAGDVPSNLYTVYAGVAWQALEATKLSFAYYYIGTAEDVESEPGKMDDSVGSEIDFRLTQKVVDGLTLDVVGAYLFADDAYSTNDQDDDAYEVGARLQWSF